jgi:hypothetical protein
MSCSQGDACQVHKSVSVLSRNTISLLHCLTNESAAGIQAALLAYARISPQLRPGLHKPTKKLPWSPKRPKVGSVKPHWVRWGEVPIA